jgi:hypothetical protein
MLIFDRMLQHGTVREAIKEKLGSGSLSAQQQSQAAAVLRHPLAMHSLSAQVLNSAQNASIHDPALSAALADGNTDDETVAAGGLTNLLNWIVQNWSQIAAIITQVLSWFGIKA